MAIFPGRETVLEAAAQWKSRCLLEDGSVLSPDEALWTDAHLRELVEHFVKNPLHGKEEFMAKLETQLEPVSAGGKRLAAEMLWVMMLFPTNFGRETKVEKVRSVWEGSGESLPESSLLNEPLAEGIGSVGPGFINHQAQELTYLIGKVSEWKAIEVPERRRILGGPEALCGFLEVGDEEGSRQLPHILAYLLKPMEFENISSTGVKRRVLRGFDVEIEDSASLCEIDVSLRALRSRLEAEYPDRAHLDFFRPPLIDRWDPMEIFPLEFVVDGLDHARTAFQSRFPEFKSFEETGAAYVEGERGYKDVLRSRVVDVFNAIPDGGVLSEDEASDLVDRLRGALSEKLRPYDWSQNLINWRYTAFLNELDAGESVQFVYALRGLKDEKISSPARARRFLDDIWPILERHNAASHAASRSLPTLVLWLLFPDDEIYIRTDTFNRMARRLTGEKLFLNKRLDRVEYEKARIFARGLREALESWGWKPKDMIDVQSFLWSADQSWEGDAEPEAGEGSDSVKEAPATYGQEQSMDLEVLMAHLESEGLHFPPTLVANYVLALQTKRFVILTGISGTGKTQLAKHVGEFFSQVLDAPTGDTGMDPVCIVPVRPDWTDGRGLLGYHNPITDEYVETPFLRILRAAAVEEDLARREQRTPRPHFVVLDEMNLARVEHYFSDFLSVLESDGVIHLHSRPSMERAGHPGDPVPGVLAIPRNVFFTGTVNVDETTHMFSPKVLDRAFTLELSEVDLDGWGAPGEVSSVLDDGLALSDMDRELTLGDRPGVESWIELAQVQDGELREVITALNRELTPHQYHFGYRVASEIAAFVLHARRQGASPRGLWAALDLAVLEKVLPKFHGTEQELSDPLDAVAFVARMGRGRSEAEGRGARGANEDGSSTEAKLPRCLRKVERMRHRLRTRGYTSFLE